MANAVATRQDTSTELDVAAQAAIDAINQAQAQEFDGNDLLLQTPILKVGQPLTKEVQDGDAEAGEFINTLTNEPIGTAADVILCYYHKGRFASDKDTDKAYVAFTPEIPDSWSDYVGEEYVGTPFSEYPEAEETYKERVNANEIEWGNGPKVSTTHNFTGFVVTDGEDGTEYSPVRLSLKRTDVPAARKILTLQRAAVGGKQAWDSVLRLATVRKAFGKNSAYVINPSDIKIVRKTTAEEKERGVQLALIAAQGKIDAIGDVEDKAVEPADGGGLKV